LQACVGRSYLYLPNKALKAAFWDTAPEVVLPRITQQEHIAMDAPPRPAAFT
jgi:hypothetical protein